MKRLRSGGGDAANAQDAALDALGGDSPLQSWLTPFDDAAVAPAAAAPGGGDGDGGAGAISLAPAAFIAGASPSLANPAPAFFPAPITQAGVGSKGATAAQLQQALNESGLSVNGAGIKVGVISDSFNDLGGAAADEASGALPTGTNVQVLKDLASGGSDEGRAMMQIVHAIAPGASLAFYTAFESEQDFANGILALAAAGCEVICDDVSYFDEPFFQNGIIAQAIQAVEAQGVTYVAAAGNDASNGYQAAWTPTSGTFDGTHLTDAESFAGSLVQTVTIGATSSYDVPLLLEWDQAYGAATSNLEILVFSNGRLLEVATNASDGEPNNPWIGVDLRGGATYQIAIENLAGPNPGLIKEIFAGNGIPVTIGGANAGTVFGHAMTPGVITAGAVSAANTPAFGVNTPFSESFSSSGAGTELLFADNGSALSSPVVLSPVAVSGLDDIHTTVPGGLSDFYGTSAASASLAGVAALILSANPSLSAAQVEQIMEETALPMANAAVSGAGLVRVNAAVAAAAATAGFAATGINVAATSALSLQYKGFDYVAFYNGAYEDSDSLPSLVQTHANSIETTLDFGINVNTSQVVADSNYTDSLAALGNTIAEAERLGLSVMVRPLIDFLNPAVIGPYSVGDWRQYYQPTNVAAFFASYKQMIVAQAQVAQQNGAQMLSIGAELDQLTGAQYLSYWTDIINSVHAVFSGKLTYSASWNTASNVSFWSQLDYEGVDCYIPLSNAQNPTVQDLVNGWTQVATASTNPGAYQYIGSQSPIQYFENLAAQSGKPLIFTELGYPNDSGAASDPAALGSNPDPTLQAELYQAFFNAWSQANATSLIGTYFWEWDPNGSTSNVGPGIESFSPQNTQSQSVITAGFSASPTVLAVSAHSDSSASPVVAGHVVTITVSLSENVTVAGSPMLQLNDNEVAGYASGSGTSTLTFLYTVQSGDVVSDLMVTGLILPTGASIADSGGKALNAITADLGLNIDALPAGPNPAPPAGVTADMILRDGANGNYEIYDIGNNSILAGYFLGHVGTQWQFAGLGGFNGSDTTDMVVRDSNTGAFQVYDISSNNITGAAALGQVGLEWRVAGFGDFATRAGETDMMLRNINTGTFEVYDIGSNAITGANALGQVGMEWQVAGFGDFTGRANESDMLLRNVYTGAFEVYDIVNGQLAAASPMGQTGQEWKVVGFGNFSGNANETDMMMRDVNSGSFELYNLSNNTITGANAIGNVGLEWQVAGFGPLNGSGSADMVLRNSNTGAFEVYDIANSRLTSTASLGQAGLEWQLGGFAAAAPGGSSGGSTAQMVQAMASFGAGEAAGSAPAGVLVDADPSQQALLTTPQPA